MVALAARRQKIQGDSTDLGTISSLGAQAVTCVECGGSLCSTALKVRDQCPEEPLPVPCPSVLFPEYQLQFVCWGRDGISWVFGLTLCDQPGKD